MRKILQTSASDCNVLTYFGGPRLHLLSLQTLKESGATMIQRCQEVQLRQGSPGCGHLCDQRAIRAFDYNILELYAATHSFRIAAQKWHV